MWLLLALAHLVGTGRVEGQLLDERLVPGGRIRVSALPSFTAWDQRFAGTDDQGSGRIDLGSDLSVPSALGLYPAAGTLVDALRSVSGDAAYAPTTGPVHGRVSHDVTRIDLGAHVGITDWLTVGAVWPRVKTRTMVDLVFMPDSVAGDLGLNPVLTDPAAVQTFLGSFASAATTAVARAEALCAAGDPGCAAATDLAERTSGLESAMRTAYVATPLFPLAGSGIGAALTEASGSIDAELRAAGLAGVSGPPVLAGVRASGADLAAGATFPGLAYREPLASRTSLWAWGDTELTMTVRLLQLGGSEATPGSSLRVLGGVLVRLGTGLAPDPDVPLALGSGDGQTDVEGRVILHATLGGAIGLRAGVRRGVQGERVVTRRVAPPGQVLAPATARADLLWEPGAYWGAEAAPAWRLTPELAVAGTYRFFTKDRDAYRLRDPAGADPGLDPSTLSAASRATTHVLGIGLTYDTVERWRLDDTVRPLQLHGRLLKAFRGDGGRVPAPVQIELGVRLFVGIPGLS